MTNPESDMKIPDDDQVDARTEADLASPTASGDESDHADRVASADTASSLPSAAGAVVTVPDALERAGADLNTQPTSLSVARIDGGLLTEDVIGHAGLAHALQEFVDVWEQRLGEFGEHLDTMGDALRRAGRRYRGTDDTAATTIARLSPDHRRVDGT